MLPPLWHTHLPRLAFLLKVTPSYAGASSSACSGQPAAIGARRDAGSARPRHLPPAARLAGASSACQRAVGLCCPSAAPESPALCNCRRRWAPPAHLSWPAPRGTAGRRRLGVRLRSRQPLWTPVWLPSQQPSYFSPRPPPAHLAAQHRQLLQAGKHIGGAEALRLGDDAADHFQHAGITCQRQHAPCRRRRRAGCGLQEGADACGR